MSLATNEQFNCKQGFLKAKHLGFSLVELSIVLVILGLLVGGILAGQNLIRAAELRNVTTEYQNHQTAVMTFKDKYFALPGDMKTATAFWGAADNSTGNTTGCMWADIGGTSTCNGNGDDRISHTTSTNERNRFWQHLANAQLIAGTYTGVDPNIGSHYGTAIGKNIPPSKLTKAGWSAGLFSSNPFFSDSISGTSRIFWLGGPDHWLRPVLTQQEAWGIDKKIDDGKPATGIVQGLTNQTWNNPCATTMDMNAEYDLAANTVSCALIFSF